MSKHPTLKDVLKKIMDDGHTIVDLDGRPEYSRRLDDFYKRLLDSETETNSWESIAADAEIGSRETCFRYLLDCAAGALSDSDPANPRNIDPKWWRSRRKKFSRLAQCAQSLSHHYREHGREELARLHKQQAEEFAHQSKAAEKAAEDSSLWSTRQRRGKVFTQEQLVFMRSLVAFVLMYFGKPYYEVCASVANIAFPRAKKIITAEHIHSVWQNYGRQIERVSRECRGEKGNEGSGQKRPASLSKLFSGPRTCW